MSNNAHVNDDEIEIHQLPEVMALQSGMMVAVDSQPTGTKSFNLSTALESKASASDVTDLATAVAGKADASDLTALATTVEGKAEASDVNTALGGKVDMPETTPAAGQVLTFDGSANTWANPPDGVYMLKYSEIDNLADIDLELAKSHPTYLLMDVDEPIVINIPVTGTSDGQNVKIKPGTTLLFTDSCNDGIIFAGSDYDAFYNGGLCGENNAKPILMVHSTGKDWAVYGELNCDGNLFGGMPQPYTKNYRSTRGSGTNQAVEVEFRSLGGSVRNVLLLPAEIQSHDFSTDTTPEQIQFMGWGVTSNRAGYRTINEVPPSTAVDSGKVLTVDNSGVPAWAQPSSGSTAPVSLYKQWVKAHGDYSSSTTMLEFDISAYDVKSAIITINVDVIDTVMFELGYRTKRTDPNNSYNYGENIYLSNMVSGSSSAIRQTVAILPYCEDGYEAIEIKNHASGYHKIGDETAVFKLRLLSIG